MVVDPGVRIDKPGVASHRVREVRTIQGVVECVQMVLDPACLSRTDLALLRVDVLQEITSGGQSLVSGVETVVLEKIAARDFRFSIVKRTERRDFHALGCDGDLLHQHVNALVVRRVERR